MEMPTTGILSPMPDRDWTLSAMEAYVATSRDLLAALCAVFILACQVGFALFDCGLCRARNAYTALVRSLWVSAMATLVYWGCGHSLFASNGGNFLGWERGWFGYNQSQSESGQWLLGWLVTSTSAQIVNGALSEVSRPWITFPVVILGAGFLQPVAMHWAWHSQGWLHSYFLQGTRVHYRDIAGSGVIHCYLGGAALAVLLYSRCQCCVANLSRGDSAHSKPLVTLGGALMTGSLLALRLLLVASFSDVRNGVSTAMVSSVISMAACTLLCTVVAAISMGCAQYLCNHTKVPLGSLQLVAINGALAGLAATGAACDVLPPWAAWVSGLMAGAVFLTLVLALRVCGTDDSLDLVPVHLGGGLVGLISGPLFASSWGVVSSNSTQASLTLAWAVAGGLAMATWGLACLLTVLAPLAFFDLVAVSPNVFHEGLDWSIHKKDCYLTGEEEAKKPNSRHSTLAPGGRARGGSADMAHLVGFKPLGSYYESQRPAPDQDYHSWVRHRDGTLSPHRPSSAISARSRVSARSATSSQGLVRAPSPYADYNP